MPSPLGPACSTSSANTGMIPWVKGKMNREGTTAIMISARMVGIRLTYRTPLRKFSSMDSLRLAVTSAWGTRMGMIMITKPMNSTAWRKKVGRGARQGDEYPAERRSDGPVRVKGR